MLFHKKIIREIIKESRNRYRILAYNLTNRKPWSYGYREHRWVEIKKVLSDAKVMESFKSGSLPKNLGIGIDERIVEYPWIISQITPDAERIIDVGSTFNNPHIINLQLLTKKKITILNIVPDSNCFYSQGVSYILSDIRNTPFKDNQFDILTCISTLEHVGMDNTLLYTNSQKFKENLSKDYVKALDEMYRIIRPGGIIFITVPFGKYENHQFLQQFDSNMIDFIVDKYGNQIEVVYFHYTNTGWQRSDQEETKNGSYFNVHSKKHPSLNNQAAAEAVACLKIRK